MKANHKLGSLDYMILTGYNITGYNNYVIMLIDVHNCYYYYVMIN